MLEERLAYAKAKAKNARASGVNRECTLHMRDFYRTLPFGRKKLIIAGGDEKSRALATIGLLNRMPPMPVFVIGRNGSCLSCELPQRLVSDLALITISDTLPCCYLYGMSQTSIHALLSRITKNWDGNASQWADTFLTCVRSRNPLCLPSMQLLASEDDAFLRQYAALNGISPMSADQMQLRDSQSPSNAVRAAIQDMGAFPHNGFSKYSLLQFMGDCYQSSPRSGGVMVLGDCMEKRELYHHVIAAELEEAAAYNLDMCIVLDNIYMQDENDALYQLIQRLSINEHVTLIVTSEVGANIPKGLESLSGFTSHLIFCSGQIGTPKQFQSLLDIFGTYERQDVKVDYDGIIFRKKKIHKDRSNHAVLQTKDCEGYAVIARANMDDRISLCSRIVWPRELLI